MVLKKFYFILVLILTSCSSSNEENKHSEKVSKQIDSKYLYTLKCASCHGQDGKLGAGGAKDLSLSTITDKEIKGIISNGKAPMPSFKSSLSNDEIEEVMKFVKNLRK